MASLLEIKKKIQGVKNTRKITKAMQLVAASKMQQFQKKALTSRDYVTELLSILGENISSDADSIYSEKRESGKTVYVLYTSDKGLCGALNTKLLNTLFRSDEFKQKSDSEKAIIAIGKKACDYAKNNNIQLAEAIKGVPEKMNQVQTLEIVDTILKYWREHDCKEIKIIAPHYKNSFTNYPVIKTLLPFDNSMLESHIGFDEDLKERDEKINTQKNNSFMLFNPDNEIVAERLHEQIVEGLFMQSFLELKAAEYSSRMIAMKNATDAADKMIKQLTLTFNKARQQAITQEIAELMGASAATQ